MQPCTVPGRNGLKKREFMFVSTGMEMKKKSVIGKIFQACRKKFKGLY